MDDVALVRSTRYGRRIDVSGFAAPAFGAVRRSFETGFEHGGAHGAALCIIHRGRVVVDLWGGSDGKGRPYDADTLQLVFSATKGRRRFAQHSSSSSVCSTSLGRSPTTGPSSLKRASVTCR